MEPFTLIPWESTLERVVSEDPSLFCSTDKVIVGDPQLIKLIIAKAGADSSFLLAGEVGTGKNVICELIHKHSRRHHAPFLDANLDGSVSDLDEKYFGRPGESAPIEQSNGGTVHFGLRGTSLNSKTT